MPPIRVVFLLVYRKGLEPGAVVNEAPVEPQSGTLSVAAAECSSPYIPTNKRTTRMGGSFIGTLEGTRTDAVVNGAPVALQSRIPTKPAGAISSPYIPTKEKATFMVAFSLAFWKGLERMR